MTMLAACHKFILRRKEVYPPFNHFQSYSADVKKCALYCNIFVKNKKKPAMDVCFVKSGQLTMIWNGTGFL